MEAAIQRVKRRVSIEQYQMFDLFVLKHWPACDVAKTLGVTIGHVYVAKPRLKTHSQGDQGAGRRRGVNR